MPSAPSALAAFPSDMFPNRCTLNTTLHGKDPSGGRTDVPTGFRSLVPCSVQEESVTDSPQLMALDAVAVTWVGFGFDPQLRKDDQVLLTHRTPSQPLDPPLAYTVVGQSDECGIGHVWAVYCTQARA